MTKPLIRITSWESVARNLMRELLALQAKFRALQAGRVAILVLACLGASKCHGQSLNLSASATLLQPGASATITGSLAATATNVAAFQFDYLATGLTLGTFATPITGKQIECSSTTCVVFGLNSTVIQNAPVFTVSTTGAGSFAISNVVASDASGNAVSLSAGPPLTFQTISKLDLNADGKVDIQDVLIATSQIVNRTCGSADVNGDGKCNVLDVMLIILQAIKP